MSGVKLSEEELDLLEVMVKSPAYLILKKVIRGEEEEVLNLLSTVEDEKRFRQYQGRIAGLRQVHNMPDFLAKRREIVKRQKEAEEHRNKFGSKGRLTAKRV